MLSVTKLLCETDKNFQFPRSLQFSKDKKPVIVWNITRRCNLRCIHCYLDSKDKEYAGELTTHEAIKAIDALSDFNVPVIIFSGGDPLLREDLFLLASYAKEKGIRCCLSTNGTLLDRDKARGIKKAGFAYVGVSMDGIGEVNDRFRGVKGAFERAFFGLRCCRDEGLRTGLRMTLSKRTLDQLRPLFDLAEEEEIPRIYISHLVYSGRGRGIKEEDLTHDETRWAMNYIFYRARDFYKKGLDKDILTGSNDADGVYLYLALKEKEPEKAEKVYNLLKIRGGNSSGTALGCIDNYGFVHPDQFWVHYSFGNVRERAFGEIWTDVSDPLMKGLTDKTNMVSGRCRKCRYLEICGGNYRVRAEAVYGDTWASDPSCYLTDEEIGVCNSSPVCHSALDAESREKTGFLLEFTPYCDTGQE